MVGNKLAYSGPQELTTGSDAEASEPLLTGAFKRYQCYCEEAFLCVLERPAGAGERF